MINTTGMKFNIAQLGAFAAQCLGEEGIQYPLTKEDPESPVGLWLLPDDMDSMGDELEKVQRQVLLSTPQPYIVRRMEFIRVPSGKAFYMDQYEGFCYMIPIKTNDYVFVCSNMGEGTPKRLNEGNVPMMLTYQLDASGEAYMLDGTKFHTISNVGITDAVYLIVETDRPPKEQPKWTGLTTQRNTGHQDFLEQDLRPEIRFGDR